MLEFEQMTFEPKKRNSADVKSALDVLRLCERTLPLLLDLALDRREREILALSARKLYLYLKTIFEKGA